MDKNFNSLLQRQIKKYLGDGVFNDETLNKLFTAISLSYDHYERDRVLSERSLIISSEELQEINIKLKQTADAQLSVLDKLKQSLNLLREEKQGLYKDIDHDDLLSIAKVLKELILKRRVMEEELSKNRANLLSVIESTQDAIWSIDRNFRLIIFNSRFTGFLFIQPLHVPKVGLCVESIWIDNYRFHLNELHKRALKGNFFSVEIVYDEGGVRRYFELSFNPIISNDEVVGVTVYSKNITDKKTVEWDLIKSKELAEAASIAKSQFLANVTHELRTPLNAIIGYSELLVEEAAYQENLSKFREDLNKIFISGKFLLNLINDILDISKIEAGRMEIHLQTTDIRLLLEEISLTMKESVEKKNNKLIVNIEPNIGSMNTDTLKIKQVLTNLLSNAAKFTENGTIIFRAFSKFEAEKNWIFFEVEDTGVGIDKKDQEKIFEFFTQVAGLRFTGSGLGLCISRCFCEMLNGELTVESTLGDGSTFKAKIPRQSEIENIQENSNGK